MLEHEVCGVVGHGSPLRLAVTTRRHARSGRRRPPFDIMLHEELKHRLGDRAEEVVIALLLQELDQRHVTPSVVIGVAKLHHPDTPDGHRGYTASRRRISTTSPDANRQGADGPTREIRSGSTTHASCHQPAHSFCSSASPDVLGQALRGWRRRLEERLPRERLPLGERPHLGSPLDPASPRGDTAHSLRLAHDRAGRARHGKTINEPGSASGVHLGRQNCGQLVHRSLGGVL